MLKEGYLTKKPFSGGWGSSRTRFFVLHHEGLQWYEKQGGKLLGHLALKISSTVSSSGSSGRGAQLTVSTGPDQLLLSGTREEVSAWSAAVQQAIAVLQLQAEPPRPRAVSGTRN